MRVSVRREPVIAPLAIVPVTLNETGDLFLRARFHSIGRPVRLGSTDRDERPTPQK